MSPAVEAAFDLDFMASKTLGPYTRKLEAADRRRWVEAFKHFVARSSRLFCPGTDSRA